MKTKWPTDLHGELNQSEFQVLLENGVPKTTEKAKNFGMKVLMVGKTTKDKKKHLNIIFFEKNSLQISTKIYNFVL